MKYRRSLATIAAVSLLSGAAVAVSIPAPKLTMSAARAIALKAWPGKVAAQELETEGGGLRYSFDLTRGKLKREVGVDANTGKVVENKDDTGKAPD